MISPVEIALFLLCREVREYFENTYDLDEYIFTAIVGGYHEMLILKFIAIGPASVALYSYLPTGLKFNIYCSLQEIAL